MQECVPRASQTGISSKITIREKIDPVKVFRRFNPDSPIDWDLGKTINKRYHLVDILGWGGMGTVYLARDKENDLEVALKICYDVSKEKNSDPMRIVQEARKIERICHPNLVAVMDSGLYEDKAFVVMELLRGKPLSELIPEGIMPLQEACGITAQACAGLEALHEEGIIHRDVKPENIFVTEDGKVKILDFDISKIRFDDVDTDPDKNAEGCIIGTPEYLAPETMTGAYDHRADIYSLGVVLYEMLSNMVPYNGKTAWEIVHAAMFSEPLSIDEACPEASIPEEVQRIVMTAIDKIPEKRFRDMNELHAALLEIPGLFA